MPNLAEIAYLDKQPTIKPFFIYGQYVGREEQSLIRNEHVRLSEEEVIVYPGSFIFAYGTTNRDDFLYVFGEQEIGDAPKRVIHFGIKNCGDIGLIVGRDPNAFIDKLHEPRDEYDELIATINKRAHFYRNGLQREQQLSAEQTQNRTYIATHSSEFGPNEYAAMSKEKLQELMQIAVSSEHYADASIFRDLLKTR